MGKSNGALSRRDGNMTSLVERWNNGLIRLEGTGTNHPNDQRIIVT